MTAFVNSGKKTTNAPNLIVSPLPLTACRYTDLATGRNPPPPRNLNSPPCQSCPCVTRGSRMLPVISHTSTVEDLFSSRTFVAASVQRDYQWNTPECETLLADLVRAWRTQTPCTEPEPLEAANDDDIDADLGLLPTSTNQAPLPDYYLGAVVTRAAADGATEIYDGLQRITTLTILMSVLRDVVQDIRAQLRLDALINVAPDKPRLMLPTRHPALYKEIQIRGEAGKVRRNPSSNDLQTRIREAARTFRSVANSWSTEEQVSFIDFLLGRVAIVIVHASIGRMARQIFVTTNLRGLPLNQADLFKGQILDIAPDEATAADMENSWSKIQFAVGDDLVPFLTAVDFINRRQEQSADCLQELVDHLTDKVGPEKISTWLKRLSVFATAWRHLDKKLETPGTTALDANIWRLKLFKWQQWKPLALLWHANFLIKSAKSNSPATAAAHERRFTQLHARCMAITLLGLNQTNRAALFGKAIQETIKGYNPLSGALLITDPQSRRIEEKLTLPFVDEQRRLVLLRWLESLAWDVPPSYVQDGTVEHILPQNPHPRSLWMSDYPDEDQRHDLCNSLGNFVLIDAETNTRLANADYPEKRGILSAASTNYRTLRGFDTTQAWTESEIAKRGEQYRREIMAHLSLSSSRLAASSARNDQPIARAV